VGAVTEVVATAAVEATQLPEAKPGKIGGTAGLVEASAVAAASDISITSPGYPTAAVIMERTIMEGTARAGRDTLTGRTAAAAADMGAATLPATAAVQVAGAAEAAGTERPCDTPSSDRWRLHSANITNRLDYESFSCLFLYTV
jgi:hypothetical protein